MPDDRARGHVSVIIDPAGREWLDLTALRLGSNRSKLLRALVHEAMRHDLAHAERVLARNIEAAEAKQREPG